MYADNFTLIKKGNYNAWSKSRAFSKYKNTSAPSYNESIVIDDLDATHISLIQDTSEGNSRHQLNPQNLNGLVNFKLNKEENFEQGDPIV